MVLDASSTSIWSLGFDDFAFLSEFPPETRVGLAAQLISFRQRGWFIDRWDILDPEVRAYLGDQVGGGGVEGEAYDLQSRSARRHKFLIVARLGFVRLNERSRQRLTSYLREIACPADPEVGNLVEEGFRWCVAEKVFVPSRKIMERLVRSVRRAFIASLYERISRTLPDGTKAALARCLDEPESATGFHRLKDDGGDAALKTILAAADRLAFVKGLGLSHAALDGLGSRWIEMIGRRVAMETASQMRRHAPDRRHGMLAIWLLSRMTQMTDHLIDLVLGPSIVLVLGPGAGSRLI